MTTTKSPTNAVSFSAEALRAVLDQAVSDALAAAGVSPATQSKAGKQGSVPKNTLVDGKTENQLRLEAMTVRAFKKAGYGNVIPRVDCMTYNLWMKSGFKVKTGEKAIKIKQLRLFHSSQVERIAEPSKADMRAEGEAAVAKSTVTQMKPKGRKASNPSQPSMV